MKKSWKRLISVVLSVAMVLVMAAPALAADSGSNGKLSWEKVDNDPALLAKLRNRAAAEAEFEAKYSDKDIVRVSIVLEDASTIERGYSTSKIAQNDSAMRYRANLQNKQDQVAAAISASALGGEPLDVVWNLTLAANIISANVPFFAIEAIKTVPGVKDVFLETQYSADVVSKGGDDPNMGTSSTMIGSNAAWANGYTGAGSKIAIIDTGLDTDHQSFDAGAFDYAISQLDKEVELMTEADIEAVWDQLNISEIAENEGIYRTSKIPFGFNYIDGDLDITHMNDKQEEHGSHVAGIAAGNRFIPLTDSADYVPALDTVLTQGVAPDAQVMIMKVFGKGGGAYDSDYMSAIEDAIVLGADVVNLSLGSGNPGSSYTTTYQDIMDSLVQSDTVVCFSAGNSYNWADSTYYGYLYSDGASFQTNGTPGSFTNSFNVASADNTGSTGAYVTVGDQMIFYTENNGYGNEPMASIAGEYEYVLVDSVGVDDNDNIGVEGHDDFLALGSDVLEGKIALCYRGSSSFFVKANAAVAQGAVGVIIINNQPGTISMNLTGYTGTAPAVSITTADGDVFIENGTENVLDELYYYTGTVTIGSEIGKSAPAEDAVVTMSDFSSWGTPGSLQLKPEITAPGGSIYSLNGQHVSATTGAVEGGHTNYELMSGTSMASPQVAGMSAVVAQYIRENGLAEKTGLTVRALAISLLMGTAVPLIEEDSGSYYPVFRQGSGLANVGDAVSAHSYILMNEDATVSYADGKVKAELGDDPDREGSYSFGFTVNNLTDEDRYYDFSADFFTQDVFNYGYDLLDTWTVPIAAAVEFTIDGEKYEPDEVMELDFNGDGKFDSLDAKAILEYVVNGTELADDTGADMNEDGEINTYDAYLALRSYTTANTVVPAGGKIEVQIDFTVEVPDYCDDNGAWIEGYVFVTEGVTDDGAIGDQLSIPVVGYYGSWTEPGMLDIGSSLEYTYGMENRPPYMYAALSNDSLDTKSFFVKYPGENEEYYFGYNPVTDDEAFMPERLAISTSSTLSGFGYSLIRNAADARFTVTDGSGQIIYEKLRGAYLSSAYYYVNGAQWRDTDAQWDLDYQINAEEDELVTLSVTFAPEYYGMTGSVDWDSVHPNATYSISATIDDTAPVIEKINVPYDMMTGSFDTGMELVISDNQYVAGAYILSEDGYLVDYCGSVDQEAGDTVTLSLADIDVNQMPHTLIVVMDYAGNAVTYKLNTNMEELANGVTGMTLSETEVNTIANAAFTITANVEPWGIDDTVVWTTSDETVAVISTADPVSGMDGIVVTGVGEGTATITATSTLDEQIYASCEVTVKVIDVTLNAVIWDETGHVWYSEFDVGAIPEYTKIAAVENNTPIVAAAVSSDGIVYASSFDSESGTGSLYTADPDTFALTEIGQLDYPLADFAFGPNGNIIGMMGAANRGLAGYLAEYKLDGTFNGAWNLQRYMGSMVGIAYAFSDYEEDEDENGEPIEIPADFYYILNTRGALYMISMVDEDGDNMLFNLYNLGSIGSSIDVTYYQSLYCDGRYLFWSRYNSKEDDVDLITMDGDDMSTYDLGSFAPTVWPVGALFQSFYAEPIPSDTGDKLPAGERISAEFVPELEKLAYEKPSTVKGGLNAAVSRNELNSSVIEDEYTFKVLADSENNNGLYTLTYDDSLELISASTTLPYAAINTDEAGKVVIGYADLEGVEEGDTILTLKFALEDPTQEGRVDVVNDELGEEKPGTEETLYLGTPPTPVTGVTVDPTEVTIAVGDEFQLTVTVEPEDATNKNVIYASADETIATVEENGLINAIAVGETTITVTTEDGEFVAEVKVTVVIPVTGITVDPTELELVAGEEFELTVTVEPEDASNKNVVFASADETIATVDENGKITAVAEGETMITVTTEDGEFVAEVKVTVKSAVLRGDFDGDGAVTSDDAVYLLRASLMDTYPLNQSGDVNGDGAVTSDDAIYLLRYTLLPDLYPLA